MRPATMILPIVLLAACAAGPSPAKPKPAPASDIGERSAYGLFLAGEAALNDGRNQEAEDYFARARAKAGEAALLSERSFTAALLAGDIDRAAALAPTGQAAPEGVERMGRLARAVKAISDGQGKAAKAILGAEDFGFPHRSAAVLLAPWAAAQAGDMEGALVLPEVRGDRMVEFFGKLGQAHLFERAKRYDEAETDFKAITSGDAPPQLMVLAYGAFLERRDRRADAIALYDAALARDPGSFGVKTARARAAARKAAPAAPTLREGAAEALLAPAATMLAAKQNQLALAHLRMSLKLDPRRDEAWIMLGDVKAEENDLEAAREAYAQPSESVMAPDFGLAPTAFSTRAMPSFTWMPRSIQE